MSQATSPFKFLDSYKQEDLDIFFGREKETNDLYHALSGVKHLLVYGPSGAGKTSLVECGLRNQFSDADWYALTIRRGSHIAGSVFNEINKSLQEKMDLDPETRRPLDPETDFGQAIERLFSERYQPVYLLFDQFEELLISGSDAEKRDFFTRLNQLIRYKVPCRVMLIMREEFIGHLSEFEPLCPSIFQHRFRLEKMRKENVKEVIRETLDAPHYRPFFRVEDSEQLAESILGKLPDKSREIELAHVQVFLSELWDRARSEKMNDALPVLREGLIKEQDNLAGVLDSFLNKQMKELNPIYGEKAPLEALAAMISERHTKLQLSAEELQKDLDLKEVTLKSPLPNLLRDLEQRRILRTIKSGDQTQYEISHDVLALVVGQNLTKEMQMRAKAADIYRVYEERKGFFSQEDLDYIRPYQQYKAYPPALEQRIQESEDYLHAEEVRIQREKDEQLVAAQRQAEQERELREKAEVNEKRARQRTRLAAIAFIFALALALLAWWKNNQAQILADETRQQKIVIETNLDSLKQKESALQFSLIEAKAAKDTAEERKILAELATIEARHQGQIAKTNLEKSIQANASTVILLLENADRDILNLRYEDALQKIKAAASLGALKPEVAKSYLEIAFWHEETGNVSRAAILLDSIADFTKNTALTKALPKLMTVDTTTARNILRAAMKLVDPVHFKFLFEQKYYPDMVFVQGGKFRMGCDSKIDKNCGNDETIHEQELSSFHIARTETTVWQFALYCAAERDSIKGFLESNWSDLGNNPVVNVQWYDAVKYANWVSKQKGVKESITKDETGEYAVNFRSGYRLPTEAEWEYAAKGGNRPDQTIYSGSNDLDSVGWYVVNHISRTRAVRQKKANGLGLFDLSGNVWEWCWDWYGDYKTNPGKDYAGLQTGSDRVIRGGGWLNYAVSCRTAQRNDSNPDYHYHFVGFRLVFVP